MLRSLSKSKLALAVVAGILVGLISLSCSEAPLDPDSFEVEGYRVYFWDEGDIPKYYSYDPVTQILDSLSLPYRSVGAKVSPDGRQMWTLTRDGLVVVMDIAAREVLHTFDSDGLSEIVLSDDGKYAALLGDELAIVLISDYSIIYDDTIASSGGVFSANGTGFYYLSEGVFRLNLEDSFSQVRFDIEAHESNQVINILPNADESKLYLILRSGLANLLGVYQPGLASFERIDILFPTSHQLALITNERFLFVTTRPRLGPHWEFPTIAYNVYDTETNEMIWEQRLRMETPQGDTIWMEPMDLIITPDDRWAIMLMGPYSAAFIALDLETMKIDQYYEFGGGHELWYLSCTGNRY